MTHARLRGVFVTCTALMLAACAGGGGIDSASIIPAPTPTPTPSPTPTPTPATAAAIKIFTTPTVGDYASVGSSISGPGGNLDNYSTANTRFGTVSSTDSDQPHFRYTGAGNYEVQMPGAQYDRLVPYGGIVDPDVNSNNYFQPQSVQMNYGYVVTFNSRNDGYLYSELAGWGSQAASRWGSVAFGVPTPASGVPLTGSAAFNGKVWGSTDVMEPDGLYGGFDSVPAEGSVKLGFDFGKGTFSGEMNLFLSTYTGDIPLGTLAFKNTIFSVGSTTYSGQFNSAAAGQNFFKGRFTGPAAQETIGAWAIPFTFSTGNAEVPADAQTHQAFGVWIAKH